MRIGRGFAAGLAAGAAFGRQISQDWQTAKTNEELQKIMTEKPEQSTGYTEEQAQQLDAAAKSGQYDIGYDQEKGAYTVTPKAGGETGALSPVQRTVLLGKTYDKALSDGEVDRARLSSMSDVMAKFGNPSEAMRLRQMGQQSQLTDLQLKGAQRQDAREQREDDFRTRTQKLVDQWNGGLLGDDDKPRDATAAETLDLGMQLAKLNAEYGKGNPLDLATIQKQATAARDEGMAKAAAYLHMTGDVAGAEKIFNASGMQKVALDPKSLQKVQMKIGGHSVPSYSVSGADASGNPFRIGNTWGELVRGMTTAELAGMPFKVEELDLRRQQVGNEGARLKIAQGEAGRAAERWLIEKGELQTRADDSKAQRAARKDLADAIESGDEKMIKKARQKAIAAGINALPMDEEKTTVHMPTGMSPVAIINKGGKLFSADPSKLPQLQAPEAPKDPKARKIGETYSTPRGNLIWRGSGWEQAK